LDGESLFQLAQEFHIGLSPRGQEPYGPWSSVAGTLTDDSRFKSMFFDHLESSAGPSSLGFAREILAFPSGRGARFRDLSQSWLAEFQYAAWWVIGDSVRGLPPERGWGGIPTMAGQMPFLPVAALRPGQPEAAYRLVWELDFMDNGIARDLNAGLVAGLAAALAPGADWDSVESAIRSTDPYRFGEVPWVPRRTDEWLDVASEAAAFADGRPDRLYEFLEQHLEARTWWEAWVPMVVVFSAARVAQYDPLATMQVILEFGHDTDSYLQVAGAFFGALHGAGVFPDVLRETVRSALAADYDDSVDRWMDLVRRYRTY
jgi:hypothetical protein